MLTSDAKNTLVYSGLNVFHSLYRELKRDKRSELFSGQFVSRVFTHAKERERDQYEAGVEELKLAHCVGYMFIG